METQLISGPTGLDKPDFTKYKTLSLKELEAGGTLEAPDKTKILQLLEEGTFPRFWYILNLGPSTLHFYHEGTPEIMLTPFKAGAGLWTRATPKTTKLPVFGWSEGEAGKAIVGYYY